MNLESKIRNLARSSYWQQLYHASKDCANISLFENVSNLSGLQIKFLYWLKVYDMLYTELATQEDSYLTEAVLGDNERCDAYLVRRSKKIETEWKKHRQEEQLNQIKSKHPTRFKKPGKQTLINVDLRREE